MAEVDIAKLKSALIAAGSKYVGLSNLQRPSVPAHTSHRPDIEQMLQTYFMKSGLDVRKLEQMLKEDQNEARRVVAGQKADAIKSASLNKEALRRQIQVPFRNPPAKQGNQYVLQPFTILQAPPLSTQFFDSSIDADPPWIKFNIRAIGGVGETIFMAGGTNFIFYFQWMNDTNSTAYVNLDTTVTFTGFCEAQADSGFWGGDLSQLVVTLYLNPLEWWIQPTPPSPLAQATQAQTVAELSVMGPSFLSSQLGVGTKFLDHIPLDVSYSQFQIPQYETAVFEVGVDVYYLFDNNGPVDLVSTDFADSDFGITCPGLALTTT